jgi:GntR family transcriptional regulator, uxu operon transcriptional repressor
MRGRPSEARRAVAPARPHEGVDSLPLHTVLPLRLYRQIAGQIAALIDNGEFPAGSRLPAERELATLLGVSRTSVREAIISLEIAGLVEVRVGTGIFVTAKPGPARARGVGDDGPDRGPGPFELLAARKLVEGEIVALAARKATAADLASLRDCVEQMESQLDDFAAREASDREFHVGLAKATGNGSLELVVAALWNQRAEMWRRTQQHFHTRKLAEKTLRDHAAILAAVARRDPEAARAAMHRHLARVEREFQRDDDSGTRAPASARRSKVAA